MGCPRRLSRLLYRCLCVLTCCSPAPSPPSPPSAAWLRPTIGPTPRPPRPPPRPWSSSSAPPVRAMPSVATRSSLASSASARATVDEQALRIAGAAWDLPAPGTCVAAAQDAAQPALQPRSVDLLDVGVLTIDARSTAHTPPRRAPSCSRARCRIPQASSPASSTPHAPPRLSRPRRACSSTRAAVPTCPRASGSTWRHRATSVTCACRPRRAASTSAGTSTRLPSDARDLVYVDVLGPSSRLVARCTALDVGQLSVPATSLGAIDEGMLSVHRLHRESFRAKGIEPGEIRFDVARVVAFHR